MIYRLNLFRDDKLASTGLVDVRLLDEAKALAKAAVTNGQAQKAELRHTTGALIVRHPL